MENKKTNAVKKEPEKNNIQDLIEKAKAKGVACMVEGIGHCPINLIPAIVKKMKFLSFFELLNKNRFILFSSKNYQMI